MKIKMQLNLLTIIIIVLLSIIVGVLLSISGLLVSSIQKAEKDYVGAIVGSLGNIIGGIIGGIVAYIVAAFQVQKTYELEKNKGLTNNYGILRLIKIELLSNFNILKTFKNDYLLESNDHLQKYLSLDTWIQCSTQIGHEVSDKTLTKLSSIYKKFKLIKEEKIEGDLLERNIEDVEKTIELINEELKRLK